MQGGQIYSGWQTAWLIFFLPPLLPLLTVFLSKLNCDFIRSLIEMLRGAALTGGCYSMQRWCLCPFKTTSRLRRLFFHPLSFLLSPPHTTHPSFFKLWRCCIRFTVIFNEQWERHSVHFSSFFLSLLGCVSQSLKLDEMYSTSVSLESSVWVSVSVCVCVCDLMLSPIQIKLQWDFKKNQRGVVQSLWPFTLTRSSSVFTCRFITWS